MVVCSIKDADQVEQHVCLLHESDSFAIFLIAKPEIRMFQQNCTYIIYICINIGNVLMFFAKDLENQAFLMLFAYH